MELVEHVLDLGPKRRKIEERQTKKRAHVERSKDGRWYDRVSALPGDCPSRRDEIAYGGWADICSDELQSDLVLTDEMRGAVQCRLDGKMLGQQRRWPLETNEMAAKDGTEQV